MKKEDRGDNVVTASIFLEKAARSDSEKNQLEVTFPLCYEACSCLDPGQQINLAQW